MMLSRETSKESTRKLLPTNVMSRMIENWDFNMISQITVVNNELSNGFEIDDKDFRDDDETRDEDGITIDDETSNRHEIYEAPYAERDRQKIYADKRRKPLEFSVGDYVLFKVSPWKGVVRFGKKWKLVPRFVGIFEIIEKVGPVAYRLDLPEELNGVHDMFHVSNLKKCLADPTL
nr:putative reverse transcriptase domain-containing protein [Tanacetum cinerariifolium]